MRIRMLLLVIGISAWLQATAQDTAAAMSSVSRAEPSEQVVSRWEAGVQLNLIGFSPCTTGYCSNPPQWSAGPGLTLNLSNNFAIDASLTQTFHRDDLPTNYSDGSSAGGRGLEVMVGPRAEVRGGRVGVFLGARVGMLNWSHVPQHVDFTFVQVPGGFAGTETLQYGGGFYFAGEADAGVEFAVKPQMHLRVEFGDQLVHYSQEQYTSDAFPVFAQPSTWDSNAMLKLGVYAGLGRQTGRPVEPYQSVTPHHFFDRTKLALVAFSLLGQASDAVTTQHFLHRGVGEADALARPFVVHGWGGQAALAILDNSAQLGVMFALHKIGHHRLERGLPIASGIEGGYSAYYNVKHSY